MYKKLSLVFLCLPLLLLSSCTKTKQNFVFILVDDLGWTDLGYSGSSFYETPEIDAFSKQSIQFTNAYASSSVCSPSRAAIMCGKHPVNLNITDWLPGSDPIDQKLLGAIDSNQLALNEKTLPEILKKQGYRTFFAGKWHLGAEGFYPENQGFDINQGGLEFGQPKSYYSPYNNPKLKDGPSGEYLTDRLTDESISFLENNKDPFLLMLSFYTVHTPIQANKQHIAKFKEKLSKFRKDRTKVESDAVTRLTQSNVEYASMVYAMDQNVGRLLAYLKEKGLYENTTIIFTSDNGGLSTLLRRYNKLAPTSVHPLRGGKGWLYEGGIRVPLLIKPAQFDGLPKVIEEPVVGHDFLPTIISMAGNEDLESYDLDGLDLSGLIKSNEPTNRKELIWHYPHYHGSGWRPGAAIRQGNWKLIEFQESQSVELYDLSNDLSENNDLTSLLPDKTEELLNRLHEIQKEMGAENASINPDYETQQIIKD